MKTRGEQLMGGISSVDERVFRALERAEITKPLTELLFMRGAVYATAHNGFVPVDALLLLSRGMERWRDRRAAELVAAGLWLQRSGGWEVELFNSKHRRCTKGDDRWRLTRALRGAVMYRGERRCRACGTTERLTIDHIVPVAAGGLTVIENLQVLCVSCNASKHAKPWDEWIASRQ